MAVMMSKEALKAMEEALAANQDAANPFVREGETTFIRYDEVRVIQRCPGLIAIEFRWRGTLTHTMYADCDFAAGQVLTLAGFEGRVSAQALAGPDADGDVSGRKVVG